MAQTKGNIEEGNAAEGEAVESTTKDVPHEADASSAPGPYDDLPINRPPVSTNQADVPIAQSLTAGAGEGNQGQDGTPPEEQKPAPVSAADKDNVEKVQVDAAKDSK